MNLFRVSLLLMVFFSGITESFSADYAQEPSPPKKLRVLIIDGQNNHDQWPKITFMMKQYLEESGRFIVDVKRTAFTWKGDDLIAEFKIDGTEGTAAKDEPIADPSFDPKFDKYDVVITNFGWNAASWPAATQKNLEKFVSKGGGLVVVHAADNSFPDWLEYNKMIGLGGWGDRTEKDGPYVYYNDDGKLIRDMSEGSAGAHGPQHEYVIEIRDSEHPITKGMPTKWLHTKDELYHNLRGPAENMEVLATAYSSVDQKGSGRHEPMLLALSYGSGRVFHNAMGHIDYSVECVGFMTSLIRGTEWAATGKVTSAIPSDFPKEDRVSSRPFMAK